MATLLVTGGAGFIGSCYVLARCAAGDTIINIDKLTYSGNLENLASLQDCSRHIFVHGDIGNAELVEYLLKTYQPNAIVNFAAESHVVVPSSIPKRLYAPMYSEPAHFCALPKHGGAN